METSLCFLACNHCIPLQFGHGGEAVETLVAKGLLKKDKEGLQVGHGGEAVETARK